MTFSAKKFAALVVTCMVARGAISLIFNKSRTFNFDITKNKGKLKYRPEKGTNKQKRDLPQGIDHNFPIIYEGEPNDKQNLIERIKDYTVQIIYYKNNSGLLELHTGTGWFLDYEKHEDNKYPTKWFLATNAHVIKNYGFKNDPYHQNPKILSRADNQFFELYRWESGGKDEEILKGMKIDIEDPEFWASEEAEKYNLYPEFNSRDILDNNDDQQLKKEIPSMHIEITDPKLLYVALEKNSNRFMDFAVVEINFPNEDSAKKMTQQVFDKEESERINFLGKVNENSQFYSAGYPGNSYNPFRAVGNYSRNKDLASKKVECIPTLMIGGFFWNNKPYTNPACHYELDNFIAGEGSSGSLVVDESGTVLGLHSLVSEDYKFGYTQPLRNKEKSCWLFFICRTNLEYDLITGSRFQNTSYKQQLLNHLPNVNTYLKDKYQWKL